ncbi:MAG: GTP 3',8-cyclase MoaA [Chloroflexota bacterium]|jgi:cyclic pyranopterin phosphate synthase
MTIDQYGRRLNYLRISLTDRCNFRCVYCMPEDMMFRSQSDLMQDDEVLYFVRLFASLGFGKFRLTGGEPTVRPHIVSLVRDIVAIPGVKSLSMTTNGVVLKRYAQPLAEAGLQRVNISLDTLDPKKFEMLTRRDSFEEVWAGIIAAEEAGLTPIKLNIVVVLGHNDDEVVDLARLTLDHVWQVRFIEMMPFGGATDFQRNQVVTAGDVKERIEAEMGLLETVNGGNLDGEARLYKLPGGLGTVGFISSVTEPFCASCSRARLTADGRLRLCLLREDEEDLLTPLRSGASEAEMRQLVQKALWRKPWGHGLAEGDVALNRVMSEIGG